MPGDNPVERGTRVQATFNPPEDAVDIGRTRVDDLLHNVLFANHATIPRRPRERNTEINFAPLELAARMEPAIRDDIRHENIDALRVGIETDINNILAEFQHMALNIPVVQAIRQRVRHFLINRYTRDTIHFMRQTTDLIEDAQRREVYTLAYHNAIRLFDQGGLFEGEPLFAEDGVPDRPNDIRANVFANQPFLPIMDETAFTPADIQWTVRERALPGFINTGRGVARIVLDQPGLATQGMPLVFDEMSPMQRDNRIHIKRLICYHCCTAMEPSEGTMVVGHITVEEAPVWNCPQCNRKMLLIRNAVDTDGMWYQRALNNILKHGTIMNYETFMRLLLTTDNTEGN